MQGALRFAATLRSSVLQRVRVLPPAAARSPAGAVDTPFRVLAALRPDLLSRLFSADSHGYLAKTEVTDRILSVVKRQQKVDPAKLTPESHFENDLGLDSLDTVETVMAFEEEFAIEIPDAEADKILSVKDAIEYIAAHPRAK